MPGRWSVGTLILQLMAGGEWNIPRLMPGGGGKGRGKGRAHRLIPRHTVLFCGKRREYIAGLISRSHTTSVVVGCQKRGAFQKKKQRVIAPPNATPLLH
ncbi:hypothetical protein Zmor_001679 [Zophobas morio]|uniref:Uncharacterized protein n=1 Tax=Zophobas morio TaxID=2755281 RepID=A0AA38J355_9CUCU|nr:hypothetical protein Zmor_001679 [Zophobas morio]